MKFAEYSAPERQYRHWESNLGQTNKNETIRKWIFVGVGLIAVFWLFATIEPVNLKKRRIL